VMAVCASCPAFPISMLERLLPHCRVRLDAVTGRCGEDTKRAGLGIIRAV